MAARNCWKDERASGNEHVLQLIWGYIQADRKRLSHTIILSS